MEGRASSRLMAHVGGAPAVPSTSANAPAAEPGNGGGALRGAKRRRTEGPAGGGGSTALTKAAEVSCPAAGSAAAVEAVPRRPMVMHGGTKWYQAQLLSRDAASGRVLVHYQGLDPEGGPFWLDVASPRLWLGSYRHRDWRYLGEGAWVPKGWQPEEPGGGALPGRAAATEAPAQRHPGVLPGQAAGAPAGGRSSASKKRPAARAAGDGDVVQPAACGPSRARTFAAGTPPRRSRSHCAWQPVGGSTAAPTDAGCGAESVQQQQLPERQQHHLPEQQQQRHGPPGCEAVAAAGAVGPEMRPSPHPGQPVSPASAIPNCPMVLRGGRWYRAKLLARNGSRVRVALCGAPAGVSARPWWLEEGSPAVWQGSYAGKDWRYVGDGAWVPREKRPGRGAAARRKRAGAAAGGSRRRRRVRGPAEPPAGPAQQPEGPGADARQADDVILQGSRADQGLGRAPIEAADAGQKGAAAGLQPPLLTLQQHAWQAPLPPQQLQQQQQEEEGEGEEEEEEEDAKQQPRADQEQGLGHGGSREQHGSEGGGRVTTGTSDATGAARRSNEASGARAAAPTAAGATAAAAAGAARRGGRLRRKEGVHAVPVQPMVLFGREWLRAKLLSRDAASGRVLVHYQGFDPEGGPFWLDAASPRLWLGSYRHRDWKYLGHGAWAPKGWSPPPEAVGSDLPKQLWQLHQQLEAQQREQQRQQAAAEGRRRQAGSGAGGGGGAGPAAGARHRRPEKLCAPSTRHARAAAVTLAPAAWHKGARTRHAAGAQPAERGLSMHLPLHKRLDKAHGQLPLWDPAALAAAVRQGAAAVRQRWRALSPAGVGETGAGAEAPVSEVGEEELRGEAGAAAAGGGGVSAAASAVFAAVQASGGSAAASAAAERDGGAAGSPTPPPTGPPPGEQHRDASADSGDAAALGGTSPDSGQLGAAAAPTEISRQAGPAAATTAIDADPGPLPPRLLHERSAALGVVVLLHEAGWPNAEAWEQWEELHGGHVAVFVHLKRGVKADAPLPGADAIRRRALATRVGSEWGCLSLTEAILECAGELAARCPALTHVAVCSGHDVPAASVPPGALRPGTTLFTDFRFGYEFEEGAQAEVARVLEASLQMDPAEARAWGASLVFHHTWMVLARPLVLALYSRRCELLRVGATLNAHFMAHAAGGVAADEFLLLTAAIRYGFTQRLRRGPVRALMGHAARRAARKRDRGCAGACGNMTICAAAAAGAGTASVARGLNAESASALLARAFGDAAAGGAGEDVGDGSGSGSQTALHGSTRPAASGSLAGTDCLPAMAAAEATTVAHPLPVSAPLEGPAAWPQHLLLWPQGGGSGVAPAAEQECGGRGEHGDEQGGKGYDPFEAPMDGHSHGRLCSGSSDAGDSSAGDSDVYSSGVAESDEGGSDAGSSGAGGSDAGGSESADSGAAGDSDVAGGDDCEGERPNGRQGPTEEEDEDDGDEVEQKEEDDNGGEFEKALGGEGNANTAAGLPVRCEPLASLQDQDEVEVKEEEEVEEEEAEPAMRQQAGAPAAEGAGSHGDHMCADCSHGMLQQQQQQKQKQIESQRPALSALRRQRRRRLGVDGMPLVAPSRRPSKPRSGGGKGAVSNGGVGGGGGAAVPEDMRLADCCPTLVLFDPDPSKTRHPHTWRALGAALPCSVRWGGIGRVGSAELTLRQALAMAPQNGSLFFRKVELGTGDEVRRLASLLKRLWAGRRP